MREWEGGVAVTQWQFPQSSFFQTVHTQLPSQGVHLAQGIHALLTCQVVEVQCPFSLSCCHGSSSQSPAFRLLQIRTGIKSKTSAILIKLSQVSQLCSDSKQPSVGLRVSVTRPAFIQGMRCQSHLLQAIPTSVKILLEFYVRGSRENVKEKERAEPLLAYMTLCELGKGRYSSRYFTAICWKIVITLYKSLMTIR